ncbi:apolipoprotein N-acyltransferase [Luteolibacter ambystomatis]|uniref:Apolipoprotein N-acyltransferase n=1 Tax=Luteolibacter ambystomatis TaxID=2824561 RepID=A0A975PEM9_9BACT|nr:apolipoprotein N-acyltransferase [Luteolibacter ambystomatis]QUE51563.1 apolipoprotein N-acyltransferase [Luteolibacter ambystomatis]
MPFLTGILLRLAACVASAILLSLAFPPHDIGVLAWVALMPMLAALWSLTGRRAAWKGFGYGWIAGLCFFGLNVGWLGTVAPIAPYALGGYLALYFACFGAFTSKWGNPWRFGPGNWKTDLLFAFANAAFWAGLEWLRSWVITGFGWNSLGVSLHKMLPLAQAADLLGVLGLSLVMLFVQILVLLAVRRFVRRDRKTALAGLGSALATMVLLGGYGAWRMTTLEKLESFPMKALLVQANLPQEGPNVLVGAEETNMIYENLTSDALEPLKGTDRFPDWVIWPESSLAGRLLNTDDGRWGMWQPNIDTIHQVRQYGDFTLLFGITELQAIEQGDQLVEKPKGKAWNSMAVMGPHDDLQTFRKHHLVIFGETIPFVDTIPWLKDIYEQQSGMSYGGSFSAGEVLDPVLTPVRGQTVGVVPSICFEDTVPRLERKFVRPGPQVIVNVTNDGWFKESEAADQHFANAMFRAIELRRPMLRCANTGVSGVISMTGRTQRLTDANGSHFTAGSLLAEVVVPKDPPTTLYAALGDWPVILLGLAGWGIGFRLRKGRDLPVPSQS